MTSDAERAAAKRLLATLEKARADMDAHGMTLSPAAIRGYEALLEAARKAGASDALEELNGKAHERNE